MSASCERSAEPNDAHPKKSKANRRTRTKTASQRMGLPRLKVETVPPGPPQKNPKRCLPCLAWGLGVAGSQDLR